MASILIIGAGIVGLQSAVTLLEAGYKVTIIAEHFPGDESIKYTSPWAGAIWRTHSSPNQPELCRWDIESYRSWMDIVKHHPEVANEMGIRGLPIHVYLATGDLDISSPSLWFAPDVQNFSILSPIDLPPGCRSGYSYDSVVLSPPRYLSYLLSKVDRLGAHTIRATLPTNDGFAKAVEIALQHGQKANKEAVDIAAVINCTGIGAGELCQDGNVFPIRGQTLIIKTDSPQVFSKQRIILQEDPAAAPAATYCFPRPGTDTFVLGGTKKPNDSSPEPDADTTTGIIARCRNVWPELRDAEIELLSQQVGLRPGRKGGVRVEVEDVKLEDGKVVKVVHQYGHSGAGYQLSIGSAGKVLGLVRDVVKS